jgi:ADP-ribosylglycohydrolase
MQNSYADKFTGALLGMAVGDALGSAVDGKSRSAIHAKYKLLADFQARSAWVTDHYTGRQVGVTLSPGTYGNHTAQALIQAISCVQTRGIINAEDFSAQFVNALNNEQPAQDLAKLAYKSLFKTKESGDYQSGTTLEEGADNGAAVRITPIALLHTYQELSKSDFLQDCEIACNITHQNKWAVQGAIAMAAAVRLLCLNELMPEDLMSAALDFLPPDNLLNNPVRAKLIVAQDYIEERQTLVNNIQANDDLIIDLFEIDLNNLERIGTTSQATETVAGAFYAFVARKNSFEEAVTLAVNAGGDTDARGAMTGALAGASLGAGAIPQRWLDKLQNRSLIEQIARSLNYIAFVKDKPTADYFNEPE